MDVAITVNLQPYSGMKRKARREAKIQPIAQKLSTRINIFERL